MKVNEILSVKQSAEPSVEQVASVALTVIDAPVISNITSSVTLHKTGNIFAAKKAGELLAWLELGETVVIGDIVYDTIRFIGVKPEWRKTRVAGAFLLALKTYLERPLILGSDEYGGVLFSGGAELVRALADSARFEVTVLDLRTMSRTPLQIGDLKTAKHKTLVFEQGAFPMFKDCGSIGRFYIYEDSL
jgi:hypothetical protein